MTFKLLQDDLTPKARAALHLIKAAAHRNSPLTRKRLQGALGYRSHGATQNIVNALVKAGAVTLDKSDGGHALLRPVQEQAA